MCGRLLPFNFIFINVEKMIIIENNETAFCDFIITDIVHWDDIVTISALHFTRHSREISTPQYFYKESLILFQ